MKYDISRASWKSVERKKNKSRKQHWNRNHERYSLGLLGGMEKSALMHTLESEEDREKKRKLEETCEGKLTRPSEDAMFLRKEIIDALRRSDEKN